MNTHIGRMLIGLLTSTLFISSPLSAQEADEPPEPLIPMRARNAPAPATAEEEAVQSTLRRDLRRTSRELNTLQREHQALRTALEGSETRRRAAEEAGRDLSRQVRALEAAQQADQRAAQERERHGERNRQELERQWDTDRQRLERRLSELDTAHAAAQTELAQLRHQLENERLVQGGDAMRESWPDGPNLTLAWALNDVALWMGTVRRLEEAEALFRQALSIVEQSLGREHAARGTLLQHLADTRWRQGDVMAASILYRDAAETFEAALGPRHPRLAAALNGWATVLRDQGRPEEAEQVYRHALEIYAARRNRNLPDIAAPLHNLALLLTQQERYDEAAPLLQEALDVLNRHRSSSPEQKALVLRSMARFHAVTGNAEQALVYEQRANEQTMQAMARGGER